MLPSWNIKLVIVSTNICWSNSCDTLWILLRVWTCAVSFDSSKSFNIRYSTNDIKLYSYSSNKLVIKVIFDNYLLINIYTYIHNYWHLSLPNPSFPYVTRRSDRCRSEQVTEFLKIPAEVGRSWRKPRRMVISYDLI